MVLDRAFTLQMTFDKGEVDSLHGSVRELCLKVPLGFLGPGEDQQAGGSLVKPMDDVRLGALRAPLDMGLGAGVQRIVLHFIRRDRQQARGFGEQEYVLIFMNHPDGPSVRGFVRSLGGGSAAWDDLENLVGSQCQSRSANDLPVNLDSTCPKHAAQCCIAGVGEQPRKGLENGRFFGGFIFLIQRFTSEAVLVNSRKKAGSGSCVAVRRWIPIQEVRGPHPAVKNVKFRRSIMRGGLYQVKWWMEGFTAGRPPGSQAVVHPARIACAP